MPFSVVTDKTRASQGREIVSVRLNTKDDAHVLNNVSGATAQPPPGNDKFVPCIDFNISPNDLALATVPGQDFDPRTRCFSEEELKPQPMIKKSRKQVCIKQDLQCLVRLLHIDGVLPKDTH